MICACTLSQDQLSIIYTLYIFHWACVCWPSCVCSACIHSHKSLVRQHYWAQGGQLWEYVWQPIRGPGLEAWEIYMLQIIYIKLYKVLDFHVWVIVSLLWHTHKQKQHCKHCSYTITYVLMYTIWCSYVYRALCCFWRVSGSEQYICSFHVYSTLSLSLPHITLAYMGTVILMQIVRSICVRFQLNLGNSDHWSCSAAEEE